MVEKVHALTAHSMTWQDTTELVGKLNRTLRGWANYFQVGTRQPSVSGARQLHGDAVASVVAQQAQGQATQGRDLSTLAPLRALRSRTPDRAWAATCRGRRREVLSESRMREICMSGSMSGMWKRSYGEVTRAPPDERGGNRQTEPTATAPHLDSTVPGPTFPAPSFPDSGRWWTPMSVSASDFRKAAAGQRRHPSQLQTSQPYLRIGSERIIILPLRLRLTLRCT